MGNTDIINEIYREEDSGRWFSAFSVVMYFMLCCHMMA